MIFVLNFLLTQSFAAVVTGAQCLTDSAQTKLCCEEPLHATCLDAEGNRLNEKVKTIAERLSRYQTGLHDGAAERRAKADAMQASSDLTLHSAQRCDDWIKKCTGACAEVKNTDGDAARVRCREAEKAAVALREQGGREQTQAKRLRRGAQ